MCRYRNESFLNTSIMIGGDTVRRTIPINNIYCQENTCNIELTDDIAERAAGDLAMVSVVAGNRFEETAATPPYIVCTCLCLAAGCVYGGSFSSGHPKRPVVSSLW